MNNYRARPSEQFQNRIASQYMDDSDDVLSQLPEWHKVLIEIYQGVEIEQT